MRYNEFAEMLKSVKTAFLKARGRDPETVRELEEFLDQRVLKCRTKGIKSLRGLGL